MHDAPSPNPAGDYRAFYAGIRDAIRDGVPPPVRVEEALDVMRVLQAGVDSAASGRVVTLRPASERVPPA